MSINYTKKLIDHLYQCINTCQHAYETCSQTLNTDSVLDIKARTTCVQAAQNCLDTCNQTIASCATYLTYATETDSIFLCRDVVEKCNYCIKNCRRIIKTCSVINKQCFDFIKAELNIFEDCIDACRRCAEHPDL